MMKLTELRTYLTESTEVQDLLKHLAREYHNRNFDLDSDVALSSSEATQSDPFVRDYTRTLEIIHDKMLQTDLTSLSSAEDEEFYYSTIWHGEKDGFIHTKRATKEAISYLLRVYLPDIDEYIARIKDYDLPKSLGIPVDNHGLVTLDEDMELRGHALILPARDTMIYPNQFLRRFYHANFVNTLNKL
jgi:hypothetical protein